MTQLEPWLRGTLLEIPAVARATLHALQLADEDLRKWCFNFSAQELNSRPAGLSPIAFHIRHIARSIDRLLTYAEGKELNAEQTARLHHEDIPAASVTELFEELALALQSATARVMALANSNLEAPTFVGKKKLPSTLGGLLVHIADHTQRHVGQAITTAKVISAS